MSIVIVIVGLVIGALLVGQDLTKASEVRNMISQMDRFNAAATTFYSKYHAVPGDIIQSKAQQFALAPSTTGDRPGSDGAGDGDGFVENGPSNKSGLGYETLAFWSDLTQADLLPMGVTILTSGTPLAPAGAYASNAALRNANVIPMFRVRQNIFVHVYSVISRNFYYVGGVSSVAANGLLTLNSGLTPIESSAMDEKMDDGNPTKGNVIAVSSIVANTPSAGNDPWSPGTAAYGEAGDCLSSASAYNAGKQFGADINCALAIRASF